MRSFLVLLCLCVISSAFVVPQQAAKHHGAMCTVCKDIIKGGEDLGDEDLDIWLDTTIGTMCDTVLIWMRKECLADLKKDEAKIKKAIEDDADPEDACKDIDLC